MEKVEVELVERFGLMAEEDGLPRIAGRIFGLFILQEEALTLEEIAELLQVSKASVSTNTRLLEQLGILERVTIPGDRRTFYQFCSDALEASFARMKRRMGEFLTLVEEMEERLPEENEVARRRLCKMGRWHAFILKEMELSLKRWRESEEQS